MNKGQNNIHKFCLCILSIVAIFLIWCGCSYFIKNKYSYNVVFHEKTQFEDVWVTEQNNFRLLSFEFPPRKVQTKILISNHDILTSEYVQFITSAALFHGNAKNILIIGLGGGSLPRAVFYLLPEARIDIVELDPKIVEISHKFFHFNPTLHNKIYVEDGIKFVNNANNSKYDVIIIDVFNKDYIPSDISTLKFVKQISRIATNDGLILFNGFANNPNVESNLLSQHFKTISNFIIRSNRIIIASNRANLNFDPKLILNKYNDLLSKIGVSADSINKWYKLGEGEVK